MMAMMAVHEQSMPKDRTNMLRGHLPPPRRCPMGPMIWTFGVPPHPDVVGPRAVSAALGQNQVGLVLVGRSFLRLCFPFHQRPLPPRLPGKVLGPQRRLVLPSW
jgi:hypothetical protein